MPAEVIGSRRHQLRHKDHHEFFGGINPKNGARRSPPGILTRGSNLALSVWTQIHGKPQAEARALYAQVGAQAASLLGIRAPEGSTFLFLNVGERLDDRGLPGLLEDCFERGVLVAPGASSGEDYADWIRLCFTVLPPEDVLEAVGGIQPLLT